MFPLYTVANNFSYIYNFISKDKKLCNKMGYIYRFNDIALPKENEITKNYADFVDGWLEASINYVMEEDIKKTFSFRKYYPQSLRKFSENIFKRKDITIDVYLTLKRILLAEKMPISAVIELCIYGITNKYPVKDVISYIKKNLEQLKQDCTYEFEQDRLLGIIKAWFCIYIVVEYTDIENLYNELLIKAHIEEKARGYGPAIAQMTMAKNVFEIFYNQDDKYKLTQDTIFGFMYFSDRYGIGSCYDCNAYKIISFLRTVFVNYARNNQKSESIKMVCSSIIQCLSWEKTRYVAEFNELFLIADLKKDFLQLVEYWCGIKGKAWNNEYSDIEYYCSSIIQTLKLFNENEKADIIQEREKMRLLGYVGNKEYSLIDLLQYYIQIPISEKKLLTDGMLLLKISDSVSDIGDNRTCFEIDQELFKVANKLGYQFLNALFEMKNRPVDFIHWRRTLLTVLFDDIKKVDSDEELLYLYSLTNAWINARFESQRPYGQLETLKQYNNKIINKISNEKLCLKLKENGNYEIELEDRKLTVKDTNNFYGIFCILEDNGYSEVFENAVMAQIEMGSGASKLLLEVREKIHGDNLIQFTNRCVKRYILKEEKYGFLYSAVREVLKTYYQYFNEESWKCILKSIVERLSWINIDSISEIGTDIEIFTLYYLLKFEPEKIEDTFLKLCSAHMKIITANGRISSTKYELAIDNDINSIYEMARYQLGEQNLLI